MERHLLRSAPHLALSEDKLLTVVVYSLAFAARIPIAIEHKETERPEGREAQVAVLESRSLELASKEGFHQRSFFLALTEAEDKVLAVPHRPELARNLAA